MTTAVRVRVPAGTLQWARERASAGIDDAARRTQHPAEEVTEWEAGSQDPPLAALRELADLYGIPLSAFLWSDPPRTPPPTVERRIFAGVHTPETTMELAKALNRAAALQEIAREVLDKAGAPLFAPVAANTPADELAIQQRALLGVSIREQRAWRDEYDALNGWRAAVERQGVFVLQLPMPGAHVRAFSLATHPPFIVLNRSDFPRARAFSLLHEYGHVLLGSAGVCEPGTSRRAMTASEPERYCNLFAGAVLVPSAILMDDAEARTVGNSEEGPTDASIDRIARRYQVSRGVIWYRLFQVGLVSHTVFNEKWDEWGDYFPARGDGGGGATTAQATVRDLGPRLVVLLITASQSGVLTTADASQYLGVSADALGPISDEVARRRAS